MLDIILISFHDLDKLYSVPTFYDFVVGTIKVYRQHFHYVGRLPLDENASCLMESNNDVEGEGLHRQIKTKNLFPLFSWKHLDLYLAGNTKVEKCIRNLEEYL